MEDRHNSKHIANTSTEFFHYFLPIFWIENAFASVRLYAQRNETNEREKKMLWHAMRYLCVIIIGCYITIRKCFISSHLCCFFGVRLVHSLSSKRKWQPNEHEHEHIGAHTRAKSRNKARNVLNSLHFKATKLDVYWCVWQPWQPWLPCPTDILFTEQYWNDTLFSILIQTT